MQRVKINSRLVVKRVYCENTPSFKKYCEVALKDYTVEFDKQGCLITTNTDWQLFVFWKNVFYIAECAGPQGIRTALIPHICDEFFKDLVTLMERTHVTVFEESFKASADMEKHIFYLARFIPSHTSDYKMLFKNTRIVGAGDKTYIYTDRGKPTAKVQMFNENQIGLYIAAKNIWVFMPENLIKILFWAIPVHMRGKVETQYLKCFDSPVESTLEDNLYTVQFPGTDKIIMKFPIGLYTQYFLRFFQTNQYLFRNTVFSVSLVGSANSWQRLLHKRPGKMSEVVSASAKSWIKIVFSTGQVLNVLSGRYIVLHNKDIVIPIPLSNYLDVVYNFYKDDNVVLSPLSQYPSGHKNLISEIESLLEQTPKSNKTGRAGGA